jgi:nucleotide-binding universal stress UspA family protein/nitrite reductase/ring-hydroxylating ferredoxin subunit
MADTYRTIVVGTDGSPTARIAETTAALLARANDAALVVASAARDDLQRAEATAASAAEQARAIWSNVVPYASPDDPASALVAIARERSADLLVVGNRGMTGRTAFLLGSVRSYRKVLLATDGSQTSLQAVRRGFALAHRLGAKPVLFYGGHPKTAEIVFREVAREFLPAGMLESESAAGDPADAIGRVATTGGYDLIVIGNRGMPGGRFHLGSVPNKVSHASPTDLLIVRTTAAQIEELERGQGAVVTLAGHSLAVYRDDSGGVHRLSPKCTHMGCTVGWNPDARTWDCPCHGSRYDALGRVIHGPAAENLAPIGEAG